MKINIKNQEIELTYSMRIYILFENITNKSLSFKSIESYTSLIVLFYSSIIATIQKQKLNIQLSYDEFMDWLDENNGEQMIKEFSTWFTTCLTNNIALQQNEESNENTSDNDESKNV